MAVRHEASQAVVGPGSLTRPLGALRPLSRAGPAPYACCMANTTEQLDRQYRRLQGRQGAEFMQELRSFYDFITTGAAPVATALAELRAEAAAEQASYTEHDRELIPELVSLRHDLVARAPEVDDAGVPRPAGLATHSMEWAFGLANFDQLAAGGPDHLRVVDQDSDPSASGTMLRILEQKFRLLQWTTTSPQGNAVPSERNQRPDLDDLARRLRNLAERHRHAAQEFARNVRQHGGFQCMYLDIAVDEMNPEPKQVESDEDEHAWMDETFKRVAGGWFYVQDAVAGRPLDERGRQALDVHVNRLKPAAERVYEGLRMKAAGSSSAAGGASGHLVADVADRDPFGSAWADLDVSHVENFLARTTEDEPLHWEAKAGEVTPDHVRRAVTAFANREGGYLILGANRDSGTRTWTLPGVQFPGTEPRTWLSNIIRSNISPPPEFDIHAWERADGLKVAVIRVQPNCGFLSMSAGRVYYRRPGEKLSYREWR